MRLINNLIRGPLDLAGSCFDVNNTNIVEVRNNGFVSSSAVARQGSQCGVTELGKGELEDALTSTDDRWMIRNTLPFNVLGVPTISVPCGFTRSGLPIGLQISAPRLEEARVFALAAAYQQATAWHRREPALG